MITLITDLHFGAKNGNKTIFENQMVFFEKQFFPYLLQNNIKDVICCGDVFDSRTSVDIYILQSLKERFFSFFESHNITFHWILGNHDIVYNSSIHYNIATASGLNSLPFVNVYEQPSKVCIGKYTFGFIPWVIDNLNIPSGVDIVCGHFDIIGFEMVKGIDSRHGFNHKDFEQYKLVFSGHYHLKNTIKNISYLGNPYQKDWGDFDTEKGFWVLLDNYDTLFIENSVSTRHVKLQFNEDESGFVCKTEGLGQNNIQINATKNIPYLTDTCKTYKTKLIINSCQSDKIYNKIYTSMMLVIEDSGSIELINSTELIQTLDTQKLEQEIKEDSDVLGNMQLYTESVELSASIDKELLTNMFKQLYVEVLTND